MVVTDSVGMSLLVRSGSRSRSRCSALLRSGGMSGGGSMHVPRYVKLRGRRVSAPNTAGSSWADPVRIPLNFSGSDAKMHDPGLETRPARVWVPELAGSALVVPATPNPCTAQAPTTTPQTSPLSTSQGRARSTTSAPVKRSSHQEETQNGAPTVSLARQLRGAAKYDPPWKAGHGASYYGSGASEHLLTWYRNSGLRGLPQQLQD